MQLSQVSMRAAPMNSTHDSRQYMPMYQGSIVGPVQPTNVIVVRPQVEFSPQQSAAVTNIDRNLPAHVRSLSPMFFFVIFSSLATYTTPEFDPCSRSKTIDRSCFI